MTSKRIGMAWLFLLGVAAPCLAQDGVITGKVTDPSGAVLPGVSVSLSSSAVMRIRDTVSDEQGGYRFGLLPPGAYTVKFELPGFTTVVREGIQMTAGLFGQCAQAVDSGYLKPSALASRNSGRQAEVLGAFPLVLAMRCPAAELTMPARLGLGIVWRVGKSCPVQASRCANRPGVRTRTGPRACDIRGPWGRPDLLGPWRFRRGKSIAHQHHLESHGL